MQKRDPPITRTQKIIPRNTEDKENETENRWKSKKR
jgi:hypothetical protein